MHASDLDVALEAARHGAAVVRSRLGGRQHADFKGEVDPVTETDRASERAVLSVLAAMRPDDHVIAEESGGTASADGRRWAVDPLDGTVNFTHGIPHVSVSVALTVDGVPEAGVVIDVARGEEFFAVRGGGAFSGRERLTVSPVKDFGRALIVTGFPYDRHTHAQDLVRPVAAVLAEAQGIRRLGSAALDLCWIAAGRFDGYWEYGLGPWDMAAGALIAAEAGAEVTDESGGPVWLDGRVVVAGNPTIRRRLAGLVAANLPPHLRR